MLLTQRKNQNTNYMQLFLLTAWGLAIVVMSFISLYVGYWLDGKFNTGPTCMLGLFFLAIFLGIGRFYMDVWQKHRQY